MPMFTDQLQETMHLTGKPGRIISVVPSQTELLYSLGLENEVIGITKFCVHPEVWYHSKTRVGGTKNLNLPLIASLKPDLIIANKEENIKEQITELKKICPVWVSDVNNLSDALEMIKLLGTITGKNEKALDVSNAIECSFKDLIYNGKDLIPAAYLIWRNPYMVAGGNTFINNMLGYCGLQNLYGSISRYPEIELSELKKLSTPLILLSSEPYSFSIEHIAEIQQEIPDAKVLLADGEMFSWYGSRLLLAAAYFRQFKEKIRRIWNME
jgi:ABC-type Fe3+-hydroxamate transport system substrate-binding protein